MHKSPRKNPLEDLARRGREGPPPAGGELPGAGEGPELSIGSGTNEPFPGIGSLPNLVWAYGIAGTTWFAALLVRFLPGNLTWILLAGGVATVLVGLLVWVLPRSWRSWMSPIAPERIVDHRARVGVLVRAEQIGATRARINRDRGNFFEPELIRPVLGVSKGRSVAMTWVAVGLGVLVLAVLLDSNLPGRAIIPRSRYFPNFFQFALAFAAGGVAADWLHPVYLTLTPGRLEVQMYGLLGRGEPQVITYDLRACRVRVNERVRTLSVLPPGVHWVSDAGPGAGRQRGANALGGLGVSLRLTPGGREFVQRVVAASCAPAEASAAAPESDAPGKSTGSGLE